jgi:hypothetical protein
MQKHCGHVIRYSTGPAQTSPERKTRECREKMQNANEKEPNDNDNEREKRLPPILIFPAMLTPLP